jgi:hypothetical protein
MIQLFKVAFPLQCYQCLVTKCALLLTLLGCISPTPIQLDKTCIPFRTIKNIPVLAGKLNGKTAFFIVDTGASVSILNESESKRFGFGCIDSDGYQVAGLGGGESSMNEAVNCEVELGTLKLKGIKFHTKRLGNVVRIISQNENIHITGIIGANVIEHYKITIDYKNRTISF